MRDNAKLTVARQLRRTDSVAEKRLWQQLRNRGLSGFKFVRQAPVGPFIADFLCREHHLIVEVDGATHASDEEIAYDRRRSSQLEKLGYRIIRLQNSEVLQARDLALTVIREALAHFPSPASRAARRPLPHAGEVEVSKQPLPLSGRGRSGEAGSGEGKSRQEDKEEYPS